MRQQFSRFPSLSPTNSGRGKGPLPVLRQNGLALHLEAMQWTSAPFGFNQLRSLTRLSRRQHGFKSRRDVKQTGCLPFVKQILHS